MKKIVIILTIAFITIIFVSCTNKHDPSENDEATNVGYVINGTLDTIADSVTDLNTSNAGEPISYLPADWRKKNAYEKFNEWLNIISPVSPAYGYGSGTSCSSGTYSDSPSAPWGLISFTITRTFSDCVGSLGLIKVNGSVTLAWSNLTLTPYIQVGSKLDRTPNSLVISRLSNGNYMTVSGTQTLTWTAVNATDKTFTVDLRSGTNRKGYQSNGNLIFDYNVTTPTKLTVFADKVNTKRTIQTGSVKVIDQNTSTSYTSSFDNVKMGLSNCRPESGTITIQVLGSNFTGAGSVSFNNGVANYTYSGKSGTITGSLVTAGCS